MAYFPPTGSVVAFQSDPTKLVGTFSVVGGPLIVGSIAGTYLEDAAHVSGSAGLFSLGVRNDTVASFVSANLDYAPRALDSAGRTLTKPFVAEEAVLRGHGSVNGVASVQLLAAAGTGLKTYMTEFMVANTGSVATLVSFTDGDASIIGRTIAPATGGSNKTLSIPIVTNRTNSPINMASGTASSVLYGYAIGYKAP